MDESTRQKNTLLFAQLLLNLHGAAMIALGKLIDPQTEKTELNLEQARFIIDTLNMLRSKCQGNLDPEEEKFFDQILSELKLNFVDEAARSAKTPAENPPSTSTPLTSS